MQINGLFDCEFSCTILFFRVSNALKSESGKTYIFSRLDSRIFNSYSTENWAHTFLDLFIIIAIETGSSLANPRISYRLNKIFSFKKTEAKKNNENEMNNYVSNQFTVSRRLYSLQTTLHSGAFQRKKEKRKRPSNSCFYYHGISTNKMQKKQHKESTK